MSAHPDLEIRRALFEEARDRLRALRKAGKTESMLAVHSLAASAAASGVGDLLALLTGLQRKLSAGEVDALEHALSDVLSSLEKTERGEDEAAELMECFAAEAEEHLDNIDTQLAVLAERSSSKAAREELSRALHTLKGSAAIVGQSDVSGAAHRLEEVLEGGRGEGNRLEGSALETIGAGATLVRALVEDPDGADEHNTALASIFGAEGVTDDLKETAKLPADRRRRTDRRRDAPFVLRAPIEKTHQLLLDAREGSRVAASLEGAALSSRGAAADLRSIRTELMRLSRRLAAGEARHIGLFITDMAGTATAVEQAARTVEAGAARLRSTSAHSRRVLGKLRATPASWLFNQLVHVAEEAAQRGGKSVAVEMKGEDIEVDRSVAGRIVEPLIHIVRNAVVHGCEPPAQRVALGKEQSGRLVLEARRSPAGVSYVVRDDGPGIDFNRIAERLVLMGLRSREDLARVADSKLVEWIFSPGVSTTFEVDELSGRGVGLDAVRAAVSRLGGSISVTTDHGRGTCFTVEVPPGVGRTRVLGVSIGQLRFALPVSSIRRLEHLPRRGIQGDRLLVEEGHLPVAHLAGMLGLRKRPLRWPVAVVIETSAGLSALEVERPFGVLEVTAHALGGVLRSMGPYAGVALDDDGEPLLLLSAEALASSSQETRVSAQTPRVLVVDDSRTIRAMASESLSTAGYEVEQAVDGLDGLRRLSADRFNLLITDLEMPRLDGMELIERLRSEPRLSRLPVVVLTSRTDGVARGRAGELGVRLRRQARLGG